MRVLFFGAYAPLYPRNAVARKGLTAVGVDVAEVRVPPELSTIKRILTLRKPLKAQLGSRGRPDVLFVPEMNQSVVPLAAWYARRLGVPLVFDPLISLYETEVEDRGLAGSRSGRALYLKMLDLLSFRLADVLLADTEEDAAFFRSRFGSRRPVRVVPVGADTGLFGPLPDRNSDPDLFDVVFWGSFIPLHGLKSIVEAAHILHRRGSRTRITLIGEGQLLRETKALAASDPGSDIRFVGDMPLEDLARRVARADLCLGIFGTTAKAQRVIPNKVYQALAVRRPLVTGATAAARRVLDHDRHALLVDCGDPEALADAILELENDAPRRERLAAEGYRLFLDRFTPEAVGRELAAVLHPA